MAGFLSNPSKEGFPLYAVPRFTLGPLTPAILRISKTFTTARRETLGGCTHRSHGASNRSKGRWGSRLGPLAWKPLGPPSTTHVHSVLSSTSHQDTNPGRQKPPRGGEGRVGLFRTHTNKVHLHFRGDPDNPPKMLFLLKHTVCSKGDLWDGVRPRLFEGGGKGSQNQVSVDGEIQAGVA